ncbi:hypothetical protein EVAR_18011_1 [Eumeta japonica]|uniref:Uncharacterized protein n=1 Tax=Eumeta variegata TaxID=151549 RepID=A0A4C1Y5M3_EUMVA|nr:hypothetical protein EVAR_18011_1 [Eumeta japonica]
MKAGVRCTGSRVRFQNGNKRPLASAEAGKIHWGVASPLPRLRLNRMRKWSGEPGAGAAAAADFQSLFHSVPVINRAGGESTINFVFQFIPDHPSSRGDKKKKAGDHWKRKLLQEAISVVRAAPAPPLPRPTDRGGGCLKKLNATTRDVWAGGIKDGIDNNLSGGRRPPAPPATGNWVIFLRSAGVRRPPPYGRRTRLRLDVMTRRASSPCAAYNAPVAAAGARARAALPAHRAPSPAGPFQISAHLCHKISSFFISSIPYCAIITFRAPMAPAARRRDIVLVVSSRELDHLQSALRDFKQFHTRTKTQLNRSIEIKQRDATERSSGAAD